MRLVLHLMRKDLRHVRWPALIWLALTIADAILTGAGPRLVDAYDLESARTIATLGAIVPLPRALLFVLIVALVVHAEPLVGTDAFWLTRPIARSTLFASKLLSLTLIVVIPSLVAQLGLMACFGVPAWDLVRALPNVALGSAVMLAVTFLAAALTSGLIPLVLWCVGIIATLWLGLAIALQLLVTRYANYEPPIPAPNDPTATIVSAIVTIVGFGCATWLQYRTRRRVPAAIVALAAFGLGFYTPSWWPNLSFYGGEPRLQADWARDPARTPIHLTRDIRRIDIDRGFLDGRETRRISAPLAIDGVPPGSGLLIEPFTLGATVRFANGVIVEGGRASSARATLRLTHGSSRLPLSARRPPTWHNPGEMWPVLLRAPVDALQRGGTNVAHYTGRFQFALTRREELATLPMRDEVHWQDGPRSLAIWLREQRGGACIALVRETSMTGAGWSLTRATLFHNFRDRRGGQPLEQQRQHLSPSELQIGGGSFSTHTTGPFDISYSLVEILPPEPLETREASIAPAFATAPVPFACSDIDIIIARHTYVGRIMRTLVIPEFRVDQRPDDLTSEDDY